MVQNLTHTTYNTTYHTRCTNLIKIYTKTELCLENPSQYEPVHNKALDDVCHVETLIRLKCEKYSVLNGTCTS